jgi:uncharacterized protein
MAAFHDVSLGALDRCLVQLAAVLGVGAQYCADKKFDEGVLLNARLFPDMFPLVKQVQVACDFSKSCAARLSGGQAPSFDGVDVSFVEMQSRVARTRDYLATVTAAQLDGAETKIVSVRTRDGERPMPALTYVQRMVLPNVFFHCVTAYNILRHNGAPVGKADFVGVVD